MPRQRLQAEDVVSAVFEHLVVVAGPSGAGKSTFVKQLALGQLDRQIRARLPGGSEKWVQLKTSGFEFWFPLFIRSGKKTKIRGATLHYNIVRQKRGGRDFRQDPALKILELSNSLTIVNLQIPPKRVIDQLHYREVDEPLQTRRLRRRLSSLSAYILRSLLMATTRALPRIIVRFGILRRFYQAWSAMERQRKIPDVDKLSVIETKIGNYSRPGWLEEVQSKWQEYIGWLENRGIRIEQVFLVSDPNAPIGTKIRWQVVGR